MLFHNVLSDLFILRGVPAHIRSDNGPEFIAKGVQAWITGVGAQTAYITPGSPWENGYIESFYGRLRDEFLSGEIFFTLREEDFDRSLAASIQYRPSAFLTWISTTGARGFDVGGTASRFEWRAAGHIKTSPTAVQLTTLEMDHRMGACHDDDVTITDDAR